MRNLPCLRKKLLLKVTAVVCVLWIVVQTVVFRAPDNMPSPSLQHRDNYSKISKVDNPHGDMGRPVQIPASLKAKASETFNIHRYNKVASDLIGESRRLPNHRDPRCPNINVDDRLVALKTSVIIVFHNEGRSALLRTVNSVVDRTPHSLLEEIILVDDASTLDDLGTDLEEFVSKLSVPCHLERMEVRSGLVKARLRGAKRAKGKTLTFLDAHCEASAGWLEPLLEQIAEDRRRVVCPIIDIINEHTFEYVTGSATTWGWFDWGLTFHWGPISASESARTRGRPEIPIRTPSMAGGLFTISRDYFYELGSYDEGMIVWGGENVEMSIRIWQCGGELLIVPCSRVGHVFRKVSPYVWPGGVHHVLSVNSLRTAMVWLDEYKEFYLKSASDPLKTDYGDVSERVALRKRLGCKSFRWYLENINPNSVFPLDYIALGEIRHKATNYCLDTLGAKLDGVLGVSTCHGQGGHQTFVFTSVGEIQSIIGCVDGRKGRRGDLTFKNCLRQPRGSQVFVYENMRLIHKDTGLCLSVSLSGNVQKPVLEPCQDRTDNQWILPISSNAAPQLGGV